jgi:hypothetical protein
LNPAVTALAVSDALLADAISPELVLVSPPEVARPAERVNGPRALEFVAVYLICLLVTLGPLLFVIFSEPVRHVAEL